MRRTKQEAITKPSIGDTWEKSKFGVTEKRTILKLTDDPRKPITYFCGIVCRKEHKISLRGWRVWCDDARYFMPRTLRDAASDPGEWGTTK